MRKQRFRPESNLDTFTSNELVPASNPILIAEGWERRFVASGPRLQEMAELYEQLGYDLLIEDVQKKDMLDECEDCQLVALLKFKTLYTRRQERPADE